jgi:N-acetylgalactosamine-6-sulfatase
MSRKPNIVFIFADDMGYGDLGCYGNTEIETPNLDRLAKQGTRYSQFHVASPVCSPSRCAAITGQYPAEHNIHGHFAKYTLNAQREMKNWLDIDSTTVPKLLKGAGYATAHYGKWHLGGGGGVNGHPDAPEVAAYGYDDARVWNGNGPTWSGLEHWPFAVCNDDDEVFLPHSDMLAANEAISFMEQHKKDPFYIDLWIRTPHTPLRATQEQREIYKDVPEPKQTYYSIITEADKQIGRVLDKLEELNLLEDTLIVFSSDNGPESPHKGVEHNKYCQGSTGGLRGRKRSLYEGGIRVPFIVSWKGKIAANDMNFEHVLSAVDLLPTFCELAGIEITQELKLDGESVVDSLLGKEYHRQKPLMWEWLPADRAVDSKECPVHAIRKEEYMLLKNPNNNRVELYDIYKDHAQVYNIAKKQEEVVKELSGQLENWTKGLPFASIR